MKKNILFSAAFLLAPALMAAESLTARQVMDKQKSLHRSTSEAESIKMALIDKKGKEEVREMKRLSMEVDKENSNCLMVFLSPKDIKGTSLLTWQHDKGADDQWLYLPAMGKKMKRIAEGSKKGYFMGTDFTYEDLSPESLDDYEYTMLREETVESHPCYVIESKPINPDVLKSSGYSKKTLWVRKDIFFTVKIEFYNKRDKLQKTQTLTDVVKVEGDLYRADKSIMDHLENEHKTVMTSLKRQINAAVDKGLFTERSVLKEEALAQ